MEETYRGHVIVCEPDVARQRVGHVYYRGEKLEHESMTETSALGSDEYIIEELKKNIDMRIAGIGLHILSTICPNDPIEGGRIFIEIWNMHAQDYIEAHNEDARYVDTEDEDGSSLQLEDTGVVDTPESI